MTQFNETNVMTVNNAISAKNRGERVKVSSTGYLELAGIYEQCDGVMRQRCKADLDTPGAVHMRTANGTMVVVASEAISQGGNCYAAADGKVASTGFVLEGTALEAATEDGDLIEMLPANSQQAAKADVKTVAAAGSAQGDAADLTGVVNVVTGADGTKGVKLPSAAVGLEVHVFSEVATNGLPVYPNTDDKINEGSADAAITIEGKTAAIFVATADDNWAAHYTANT